MMGPNRKKRTLGFAVNEHCGEFRTHVYGTVDEFNPAGATIQGGFCIFGFGAR